jgi:hypothetical protein
MNTNTLAQEQFDSICKLITDDNNVCALAFKKYAAASRTTENSFYVTFADSSSVDVSLEDFINYHMFYSDDAVKISEYAENNGMLDELRELQNDYMSKLGIVAAIENITYTIKNSSEFSATVEELDDGSIDYVHDERIFWAHINFTTSNNKTAQLYAQHDYSGSWEYWEDDANIGIDDAAYALLIQLDVDVDDIFEISPSHSSYWFKNTDYAKLIERKIAQVLNRALKESEPDTKITKDEIAEYIREEIEEIEQLEEIAEYICEIVPTFDSDDALIFAFYNFGKIKDVGAWECAHQICSDMTKDQTVALVKLLY